MGTKGNKLPGEVYSQDELNALLAQCSRRAPTGIRDRAMLTVVWRCGLRISEALDLTVPDIDVKRGTVTVMHGKNDKRRVVGIGDGALAVLQLWLDCRKNLGLARKGTPVFCTLKGTRMFHQHVDQMLKRRAAKAGIEKRAHLHGLRHSYAVELATREPVAIVQQALGHKHLTTTAIYLDHLSPEGVIAAGRADPWTG